MMAIVYGLVAGVGIAFALHFFLLWLLENRGKR